MVHHWTHPTPERFGLAISAIAAADRGICSEVETDRTGKTVVTFTNGHVVYIKAGKLQAAYNL